MWRTNVDNSQTDRNLSIAKGNSKWNGKKIILKEDKKKTRTKYSKWTYTYFRNETRKTKSHRGTTCMQVVSYLPIKHHLADNNIDYGLVFFPFFGCCLPLRILHHANNSTDPQILNKFHYHCAFGIYIYIPIELIKT